VEVRVLPEEPFFQQFTDAFSFDCPAKFSKNSRRFPPMLQIAQREDRSGKKDKAWIRVCAQWRLFAEVVRHCEMRSMAFLDSGAFSR
jgi:hypothetical protein